MRIYLILSLSFIFTLQQNLYAGGMLVPDDSIYTNDFVLKTQDNEIVEPSTSLGLSYEEATQELVYRSEENEKRFSAWVSILPPLIAIAIALIFKEVHIALIIGIFFGIFTLNGFQLSQLLQSFLQIADTYILQAVAYTDNGELQTGHLSIIIFSVLIGGMVHIISKNGGMNGVVAKVSKLATSGRRSQFATMLMGCLIFFDDYANSLVVGNTMRPLTDKFKISREKLAYIVDSTAAPIAAVAFVTTWIGYQLSEIEKGLAVQNFVEINESAYSIFLGSLKYAYYPIFTLFFMALLIFLKKDFGPMLKAEQDAKDGKTKHAKIHVEDKTTHWINAALPVFTLVATVIIGLLVTGYSSEVWESGASLFTKLRETFSNADSYLALIWASFLACVVAIFISLVTRSSSIKDSMDHLIEGFKTMVPAVVILILAWALAGVIENLHTAEFISSLVPLNFNAY